MEAGELVVRLRRPRRETSRQRQVFHSFRLAIGGGECYPERQMDSGGVRGEIGGAHQFVDGLAALSALEEDAPEREGGLGGIFVCCGRGADGGHLPWRIAPRSRDLGFDEEGLRVLWIDPRGAAGEDVGGPRT